MFSINLSTWILDEGFHLDIFSGNFNISCKIRTYFVYTLFAIWSSVSVVALIDRFYSTNESALKHQRFYSTRMTFKFIYLTIIGCLSRHIHVMISYESFFINKILLMTCHWHVQQII